MKGEMIMARIKSDNTAQFTVKCPPELLADLQDLARLSRCSLSQLVADVCSACVDVNHERIANFRLQAASPINVPDLKLDDRGGDDIAQNDRRLRVAKF